MSSKHNQQSLSQIRHKDTPLITHPPNPYSHNVPTTPLPVRNESPHPPTPPLTTLITLIPPITPITPITLTPLITLITLITPMPLTPPLTTHIPRPPRRGGDFVNPRQRRGSEHYTETVPAGLYPHILLPPSLSTPLITPTTIAPQSPGPNYHKPPRACPWACFAPTGAR